MPPLIIVALAAGGLVGFIGGRGVDGVSRGLQYATIGAVALLTYKVVKG